MRFTDMSARFLALRQKTPWQSLHFDRSCCSIRAGSCTDQSSAARTESSCLDGFT
jgi:hypothetical protein